MDTHSHSYQELMRFLTLWLASLIQLSGACGYRHLTRTHAIQCLHMRNCFYLSFSIDDSFSFCLGKYPHRPSKVTSDFLNESNNECSLQELGHLSYPLHIQPSLHSIDQSLFFLWLSPWRHDPCRSDTLLLLAYKRPSYFFFSSTTSYDVAQSI